MILRKYIIFIKYVNLSSFIARSKLLCNTLDVFVYVNVHSVQIYLEKKLNKVSKQWTVLFLRRRASNLLIIISLVSTYWSYKVLLFGTWPKFEWRNNNIASIPFPVRLSAVGDRKQTASFISHFIFMTAVKTVRPSYLYPRGNWHEFSQYQKSIKGYIIIVANLLSEL